MEMIKCDVMFDTSIVFYERKRGREEERLTG